MKSELTMILKKHRAWLNDKTAGERADLRGASLRDADLRWADLSNSKGLLSPIEYMYKFATCAEGYIAYKIFNLYKTPPSHWDISEGSEISEVVNPNSANDCGCGVNVATLDWIKGHPDYRNQDVWKVLIKWEWLPGVVVPYNTDGKIRCERVKLLEIVERSELSGC